MKPQAKALIAVLLLFGLMGQSVANASGYSRSVGNFLDLPAPGMVSHYVQTLIEQRLIIRIPARAVSPAEFAPSDPRRERPREPELRWKERKAPKCIAARSLFAVQAVHRDSIDLVTRENTRLRARLGGGCRGTDFYQGLYFQPPGDGMVCQDRERIHSRAGSQCKIDQFRTLVPDFKR